MLTTIDQALIGRAEAQVINASESNASSMSTNSYVSGGGVSVTKNNGSSSVLGCVTGPFVLDGLGIGHVSGGGKNLPWEYVDSSVSSVVNGIASLFSWLIPISSVVGSGVSLGRLSIVCDTSSVKSGRPMGNCSSSTTSCENPTWGDTPDREINW